MDLFEAIERYGDLRENEVYNGGPRTESDAQLDDIRAEFEHNGRSPMPTALVQRMQSLVVQFAGFDLDNRRGADELDAMHAEAGSVRRAIEAWYEETKPEGGAS